MTKDVGDSIDCKGLRNLVCKGRYDLATKFVGGTDEQRENQVECIVAGFMDLAESITEGTFDNVVTVGNLA